MSNLDGPKARLAVDYTLPAWEPHKDPTEHVANSHSRRQVTN